MKDDLEGIDITLRDVEIAIKIIKKWIKVQNEINSLVSRVSPRHARMRPEDMIFQMMFSRRAPQGMEQVIEEAEELTDEERRRLEEIKKELDKKYSK